MRKPKLLAVDMFGVLAEAPEQVEQSYANIALAGAGGAGR